MTINGFTFTPKSITVAAGGTLKITNSDTVTHTTTTEAAANDFVAGMATGGFSFNMSLAPGASETIHVPAGLASGTIQPYFCAIHTSMMTDPNPTVVIK